MLAYFTLQLVVLLTCCAHVAAFRSTLDTPLTTVSNIDGTDVTGNQEVDVDGCRNIETLINYGRDAVKARANFYHHMYDCCKNETAHNIKFGWVCSKDHAQRNNTSCRKNPYARRKYSFGCVEADWKCLTKESVHCLTIVSTSSERLRNQCHCTNAIKAGAEYAHSCSACTQALEMMLLRWHYCYNYTEDPCSQAPDTVPECTTDLSHIDEQDYECIHARLLAYACKSPKSSQGSPPSSFSENDSELTKETSVYLKDELRMGKRKNLTANRKKRAVSPGTQEQQKVSREMSNETDPECVSVLKPDTECRICLQEEEPEELITPCNCKGSVAYVHQGCLNSWLRISRFKECRACLVQYELMREGLKPLSQLSLPRPISNLWPDIITFCFTLFVIVLYTILLIVATTFWIRHGDNMFDVPSRVALKSRLVILLWWSSVAIQPVAYFYSVYQIFRRWIQENSVFEWKAKYQKKEVLKNGK
ncbi:RING-variant domain-containing protein [Ditylenchus destructor]|uniref:RING-variant domain-containing protein n=1 Tax=Ditylenchus destructor TaxID=166010 RepID=A0AAD4QYH6_9BILA|nr:RING-variant domain-containing protein [Ditylenchus destructor]